MSLLKAMGYGVKSTPTSDRLQYEMQKFAELQQSAGMAHAQSVGGGHVHSHTRTYDPALIWKEVKKKLLYMRLEIQEGELLPFVFIDFMQGEECVYVMVAKTKQDKPIIIEDDSGLFPSDTLVTQLRLMMG